MANHQHPPTVLESANDYREHERTYKGFITGVKWMIYGTAISLVLLYFIIQP